jgi:hypothetical protein
MSETPDATIDVQEELDRRARRRELGWLKAGYDDPRYRGGTITVRTRGSGDARQADVQLRKHPTGRPDSQHVLLVTWEVRKNPNYVPDERYQWSCRRYDEQPGATSYATDHPSFALALATALADASSDAGIMVEDFLA